MALQDPQDHLARLVNKVPKEKMVIGAMMAYQVFLDPKDLLADVDVLAHLV